MYPATTLRKLGKLQYAAARLPLSLLDDCVARHWHEDAAARVSLERFLGTLDLLVGRLLADDAIRQRGWLLWRSAGSDVWAQATTNETVAGEPAAGAPANGPAAGAAAGAPAGPAALSPVVVIFTLPAAVPAESVALCGDFNDWSADATPLELGSDGYWRVAVALQPGRSYRYRYLINGKRWENAWDADGYVPNAYGGTDSVVVVE
jgi:hypothetical protein